MSNDIFYDYKNHDLDQLIFNRPIKYYKDYKKTLVLTKNKKKITILTPYMIMPYNIKDNQNKIADTMCLSFIKNGDSDIGKLFKFYVEFEKFVEKTIKKKFSKNFKYKFPKFKPSVYKKNNSSFLSINLPFNIHDNSKFYKCKVINPLNEKIDIKEIGRDDKVSVLLELSDIWMRDDDFGCNWTVLLIKKDINMDLLSYFAPSPSPIANVPKSQLNNSKQDIALEPSKPLQQYNKYIKMNDFGVPIGAIKNNMIIDGYDKNIVNNLPDTKQDFLLCLHKDIPKGENMSPKLKIVKSKTQIEVVPPPVDLVPTLSDILNAKNKLKSSTSVSTIKLLDVKKETPKKLMNIIGGFVPDVSELLSIKNRLKRKKKKELNFLNNL